MTAYRHAEEPCDVGTLSTSWAGQWSSPCGCTDPQPDPESPCGSFVAPGVPCGAVARIHGDALGEVFGHPHIATRCLTCGHEVTRA